MEDLIYCLVDPVGRVYVKNGAQSSSEAAAAFGLDPNTCNEYRFDVSNRRLLVDRGGTASERMIHAYIDQYLGTPDKLMTFAEAGHLPKRILMNLLAPEKREAYLEACAVFEKQYTDDCAATNDPCLESGCALEGEICLQPLVRAEIEYQKSCGAEWIKMFANPGNRIQSWKN